MLHLKWWLPEFILSIFVFTQVSWHIGRLIGRRQQGEETSAPFFVGAIGFLYFSSFLLPLRHWALPVLVVLLFALIKFSPKGSKVFKIDIWDFLVIAPVIYYSMTFPISLDSRVDGFQRSLFQDFWARDSLYGLDSFYGLSGMFWYWQSKTPVFNHLSVHSGFLALVCWRGVRTCWEALDIKLSKDRKLLLFGLLIFVASIFYRRQIFVKASPLGGICFLVFLFLLNSKSWRRNTWPLGLLIAGSFLFGYYGALVGLPVILFLLLSKIEYKSELLKALLASYFLVLPDLIRKIVIFRPHDGILPFVLLGLFAALASLVFKFHKRLIALIPQSKALPTILFLVSLGSALVISFWGLKLEGVPPELALGVVKWFGGREGLLGVWSIVFLYQNRNRNSYVPLLIQIGVLFFGFTALRFFQFKALQFTAGHIFFENVYKDAVMITFPVIVTVVGAYSLLQWKAMKSFKFRFAFIAGLVFLQDPFVHSFDSNLSPYGARLSVLRSLSEMLYKRFDPLHSSSKDGAVVLYTPLALSEPDIVQTIYEEQFKTRQNCVGISKRLMNQTQAADYDVSAYTVEYVTGVPTSVLETPIEKCEWWLASKDENCTGSWKLEAVGNRAIICRNL